MKRIRQFQIHRKNLITRLEKSNNETCNVCLKKFQVGDFIHISNGRNTKYYHEDCYGRLLH